MDHKLIVPSATRILCNSAAIAVMEGTSPGNTFLNPSYCAAVNGDALFFFWGAYNWGSPLVPLSFLRVKPDGQFCWYSTARMADIVTSNPSNFSSAFKVSSNQFYFTYNQYGYNVSTYLIVPEYFVPGGFVHLTLPLIKFPQPPCGSASSVWNTYFAGGNTALIEYIQAFPLAYNLWAMTANVSINGFSPINQGFCGNFSNGPNPLYENTISLYHNDYQFGFANSSYSYDHNGNLIYRDVQFNDLLGNFLVVGGANIKSGNLNCAGTGTLPLYSNSIAYSYDSQNAAFNGFTFKTNYENNQHAETDINASAVCNYYGAMEIFNGNQFVELSGAPAVSNAVYLKDSNVWISTVARATSVSINTPRSILPDFGTPPVVRGMTGLQLVNFHRPVSIFRNFKT